MSVRITAAEVRAMYDTITTSRSASFDWHDRLALQLEADERERATDAADATEMRLLRTIINHPARQQDESLWLSSRSGNSWACYAKPTNDTTLYAPTLTELKAKLDALLPKPEEWVWVYDDGGTDCSGPWPTADACRDKHKQYAVNGQPMRRVKGPRGVVTYYPEGVSDA